MHLELSTPHHSLISDRSSADNETKGPEDRPREDGTHNPAAYHQCRPKKVSFNKGVRLYHHIHINDITDDEVMNTWYRDEDIRGIVAEVTLTINVLGHSPTRSAQAAEKELCWLSLCLRGLEFRTLTGISTRRQNRYLGWDTVLDLQEAQYNSGCESSDELIAQAYSAATRHCREAAYYIGLSDAQAAQQYVDEDNNKYVSNHPLDIQWSSSHDKGKTQTTSLQPPVRRTLVQSWFPYGKVRTDRANSIIGPQHENIAIESST
jgi:hypothetical protein